MKNDSGETLVVVANQIVQARHKLDPRQQKVIAWAIGQIARDDTDFTPLKLSVSEFAKLTGTESGNIYSQMEAVTKSLLRSVVEIRIQDGDRRRIAFQWLSECTYRDGQGTVDIQFHERLKPYLLELRSRFTQLRLERFYKFRSTYTIRFFERVEMQRGLNRMSWQMTLADLKDWLGLEPTAYADGFSAMKAYVLDVAQKELDTKSDWSFSFVTIKTGRKITGVEFTIRPSRSPKVDPSRDRWKKAPAALRARVIENAKTRPIWSDKGESEILNDAKFWEYLPALFEAVEKGQSALALD